MSNVTTLQVSAQSRALTRSSPRLASPSIEDRRLEAAIAGAFNSLIAGKTNSGRRAAWFAMVALIKRRSPRQIAKMEIKRGLRAPGDTWRTGRCAECGGPVSAEQWLCAGCAQPREESAA